MTAECKNQQYQQLRHYYRSETVHETEASMNPITDLQDLDIQQTETESDAD
jgi:hypothetical protein